MNRSYLPQCSAVAAMLLMVSWGATEAWTKVIVPAREAARRTQCKNNLFQHSGWHHGDRATVGADGRVLSVHSCPLCCSSVSPIYYFSSNGDLLNEADMSFETQFEARKKLLSYKSTPRYREISDGCFEFRNSLFSTNESLRTRD